MHDQRWVRIIGDGVAFDGACTLDGVLFAPDTANDYVDVYDGIDATAGRKFARIKTSVVVTWQFDFPDGVHFDRGIYLDGIDGAVETTVMFTPQ